MGWGGGKIQKYLALWKRLYISKGGRLTLIRSMLSHMPIYLLSLLHIPRVVRLRLEKIQKGFSLGRRGFGEEDAPCKLEHSLYRLRGGRIGY